MNDMLTGRCLCACAVLEMHFGLHCWCRSGASRSTAIEQQSATRERVTFSDAYTVVGVSGTHTSIEIREKMLHFQPKFHIENCIPRPFSATTNQTRPLSACHNTTQQALSIHLCSIVSSPSIPDLDEKHQNRVFSPMSGETRLNSCVCEVHEGGYSTDYNSLLRARCVQSIEQERDP